MHASEPVFVPLACWRWEPGGSAERLQAAVGAAGAHVTVVLDRLARPEGG